MLELTSVAITCFGNKFPCIRCKSTVPFPVDIKDVPFAVGANRFSRPESHEKHKPHAHRIVQAYVT